jgi:hypothetical protein
MSSEHAYAKEVSSVCGMRRWNDAGKGDRIGLAICQPPMTPIKCRNGCAIKKSQAMKIRQRLRDFVVGANGTLDSVDQLGARISACSEKHHFRIA